MAEKSVKTLIFHISSKKEIVIRPKKSGETYPTHRAVRILLSKPLVSQGSMIHLVQKCSPIVLAQALIFEPEKKWKKCPNCQKKNWSAWMPVQMHYRELWPDGSKEEYPSVPWYIICIHCGSIVTVSDFAPYKDEEYEYVYDPADDIPMGWAGWPQIPSV